jgi:hypothetical protein
LQNTAYYFELDYFDGSWENIQIWTT